uniref:Choline transporter-like protein n=1 Tax=Ciona savignyi TaxID=51511 RepID=H2Z5I5_CIOSA
RPEKSKRITDASFLIVLAICIAGMIYLAYFCFLNGRPLRYIYGSDSFGNVCGRDDNSRISGVELSGLDMSGNKLLLSLGLDSESGLKKSSLCVKSCPTGQMTCEQMLEANGYQLSADSLMRKRICGSSLKMGYFVDSDKRCLLVKENKVPIHQDILPEDTDILGEISQFLIKFTDTSVRCVLKHWKSMMCTCCMTAAICFVLVLLFQTIPRVTIILMLGTFTLTFAAVTGFLIYCTVVNWPAQETEPTPELKSVPEYDKYEVFKAFIIPLHIRLVIGAVLTGVITLAIVFSIVWNRKTIAFLIDLNIEVAAMIREIPTINFQPILTILFQVAIFVYFVSVLLFMLTTDTPAPDQDNMVINIASPVVRTLSLLAVHLISCLWLSAFVDGCHQAVVSGTMSWFIFYQATASTCSLCFPTIIPLLGIVGRSLGSITLASVVVPITRIPRSAFSLMGRILKPNMRIPLEHVLEPLSARAYIRIGMYGEGFIQAGTAGFTVLYSFAPKSMALLKKNRFYLHIGKFVACVFASLTAMLWIYFCLEIEPTKHIDVVATLVIPAFGLAYITASCFINFSHIIAETLFMCYCYDRQLNDES